MRIMCRMVRRRGQLCKGRRGRLPSPSPTSLPANSRPSCSGPLSADIQRRREAKTAAPASSVQHLSEWRVGNELFRAMTKHGIKVRS